jgi:twinkle protein
VFGDLEKGHMSLLDTLKQRLTNRVLAVRKEDYLGEKDANDILRSFGTDAVRKAVENAQEPDIGYVKELADVEDVDLNLLPKVKTGLYEIDSALGGGICYGQVCLLTGKRGNGKSTFMSNIVANALDQDVGVFCYSGELAGYHFKRWLNCQLAGDTHMIETVNEYGEPQYTIDSAVSKQISEWYRGRAFIYDNGYIDNDKDENETLAEIVKEVASRRNVKLICIDNLMTAMETVDEQSNLYLAQSNFVGELKKIAVRYDVAIILVAHPRKQGKGEDTGFDNDDVAGSGDITNKVDIVMSYGRAGEGADHDCELIIAKNRLAGTLKMGKDKILLNYSAKTKRVTGMRELNKHYGWEKQGIDVTEEIDVPF